MLEPKQKITYLIAFVFFTYISLNFYKSALKSLDAVKNGKVVSAIVLSTPDCGRSASTMEMKYENKGYTVNIGKNTCRKKKYRIGDSLEVYYSDYYDKLVFKTDPVKLKYWISLLFFMVPLFCIYKIVNPQKKKS